MVVVESVEFCVERVVPKCVVFSGKKRYDVDVVAIVKVEVVLSDGGASHEDPGRLQVICCDTPATSRPRNVWISCNSAWQD